jgi:hypothetical protein
MCVTLFIPRALNAASSGGFMKRAAFCPQGWLCRTLRGMAGQSPGSPSRGTFRDGFVFLLHPHVLCECAIEGGKLGCCWTWQVTICLRSAGCGGVHPSSLPVKDTALLWVALLGSAGEQWVGSSLGFPVLCFLSCSQQEVTSNKHPLQNGNVCVCSEFHTERVLLSILDLP